LSKSHQKTIFSNVILLHSVSQKRIGFL